MRNPLLTDGNITKPLSEWRKQFRGYTIEKNDNTYHIQNCNFQTKTILTNIETPSRKEYMRSYMNQKRFKIQPGLKIDELAKIKFVTGKTILNNLTKFDILNTRPLQIKITEKIFEWHPQKNFNKLKVNHHD